MDAVALRELKQVPLFARLTDDELGCLASGEIVDLPEGATVIEEGHEVRYFVVMLAGELRLVRHYGQQEVLMGVSKPGMFSGEIPLLLGIPALASVRVSKPARLYRVDPEGFWRLLSSNPDVSREIFRAAANRVRNMEGYSHQREKLMSLGTMAAGLAHEINNPAAAARRAAAHLQEAIETAHQHTSRLAQHLTPVHWTHLLASTAEAERRLLTAAPLDSLERSDREEALAGWLTSHGVPEPWESAPVLVAAGLDAGAGAAVIDPLPSAAHGDALGWLAARLQLRSLLQQIEQSTARVSELVKAVKSYSYMDQSPMQDIDIHEGIESTLTMLGHKLKNVTLRRAYDRSLPRFPAYGSELNQVWTNLIDNAIDAVQGRGNICVGTCLEHGQAVVEIVDDGPGIPADVRARIFEPFFTTKSVGSGTGLGLVISNRIVADRHGGEIEFESKAGETRFRVRLPIRRAAQPGTSVPA
jgi:signal transduction histidine kinase